MAKGTVTIFLALVTTPLLMFTLMLVESVRYQSEIETMLELMDNASLSTLANYDEFMQKRFGLLSISGYSII